ncbi:MAG TPA: hypothetical protein VJU15_07460 [Gemmatimonadales bacterium]|nr:hypothetical protein [Gemmatimonadales bacterium]
MNDLHDILRQRLLGLPRVVTRKMFGAEAYFVGPAMFAFFTPTSVVVRLPPSAFTDAVSHGVAKPFLSFGAAQVNGWAEIGFDGREETDLTRWVASAHASGTHAARSAARRKKPSRARRVAKR